MNEGRFFFELGAYECVVMNDWVNNNPIDRIFTGIPEEQLKKALREKGYSIQSARFDTNVLLLRSGEQSMLVDSGWGQQGALLKHLSETGKSPDEIDTLILTHSDADHTGGLLNIDGNLVFPNAQYVMARGAWKYWGSQKFLRALPNDRSEVVRKLLRLIEGKIQRVDPEEELLPGVIILDSPGHREGHIALQISSEGENLLHVADGILHPMFIYNPTWRCNIDSDPYQAADTRVALLSRATENNMMIASSHLPFPGIGHVKILDGIWNWRAREKKLH